MHILCVYATHEEGEPLVQEKLGVEFMDIGIGKTSATHTLVMRLEKPDRPTPDLVVNFGICGAYRGTGLQIGDVCMVLEEHLADEGVLTDEGFRPLLSADPGQPQALTMDPELTRYAASALGVPIVNGATVSTCSGTDRLAADLQARTAASIETMEGAAIAFCCHSADCRPLQIRAVSNYTGTMQMSEWDLELACENLHAYMRRLIPALLR